MVKESTKLIFVLVVTLCRISPAESASSIATPETITKMSSESEEKFLLRKQRITYGTNENRKHCKNELAIKVGLCKGGSQSSCFTERLYKAWCVAPGENAANAVAKLPRLSREDYFYIKDGDWLTRSEYCLWLSKEPVRRGNVSFRRNLLKRNCQ